MCKSVRVQKFSAQVHIEFNASASTCDQTFTHTMFLLGFFSHLHMCEMCAMCVLQLEFVKCLFYHCFFTNWQNTGEPICLCLFIYIQNCQDCSEKSVNFDFIMETFPRIPMLAFSAPANMTYLNTCILLIFICTFTCTLLFFICTEFLPNWYLQRRWSDTYKFLSR